MSSKNAIALKSFGDIGRNLLYATLTRRVVVEENMDDETTAQIRRIEKVDPMAACKEMVPEGAQHAEIQMQVQDRPFLMRIAKRSGRKGETLFKCSVHTGSTINGVQLDSWDITSKGINDGRGDKGTLIDREESLIVARHAFRRGSSVPKTA